MRSESVQPGMTVQGQASSSTRRRPAKPPHNNPKTIEDFERERMGIAPQE